MTEGALSVHSEVFGCESLEKLRRKDRDVCSLICVTVYYLRYLRIHTIGVSWNVRDTENSSSLSRCSVTPLEEYARMRPLDALKE